LKHCSFAGLHGSSGTPAEKGVGAQAQAYISDSKQQSTEILTSSLKHKKTSSEKPSTDQTQSWHLNDLLVSRKEKKTQSKDNY